MKSSVVALAVLLGFCPAAPASAPSPLTSLRAVHALTNADASHSLPVQFEATVVYSRGYENLLFVQDEDAGIFVRRPAGVALLPGDRVLVRGTTTESFRPIIVAHEVSVLHHGSLPKPAPATFDQLIKSEFDCRLVTVHATVRAADVVTSTVAPVRSALLQLVIEGGYIKVTVDSDDSGAVSRLLDAEVEVTGVAGGVFDDKMQQTGVELHVSKLSDIAVRKYATAGPWSLPVTPMGQILSVYHVRDLTPRVRVHGIITYYQPGTALVLQDGARSLWIATHTQEPMQIGDEADATGFPEAHDRLLTLTDGEIQDSHILAPVLPQLKSWRELALWSSNSPDGHQDDLVSIEGQVTTEVREASQDEYVLVADGKLFTAIYRHPPRPAMLPPMMQIPLGSRVRITGICIILNANTINPGDEAPFNILLRSFDDIALVARPSLMTVRNLTLVVGLLLLVVVAAISWVWILNGKVRRQTAALSSRIEAEAAMERATAERERQRSRILEDINGTSPLAGILEQITELVSFGLGGAPCWCEVTDGARLGRWQPNAQLLRVISADIPARSGQALGSIFAGFLAGSQPDSREEDAVSVGAKLATLAIETRRLYADLRHRSEFDLLTDIHNRGSLDRLLNAQIEEARQQASIFGLIYIDLDEFKQVNDLYGHQVGDMYLQEVAQRMKRQLRPHDMLARLGGDEFAVLVTMVRSRAEVEEIAVRLEHSLDDDYAVENYLLHGTASVGIALYPEDASTRDSLLSVADAAMYVAKHTKRDAPAGQEYPRAGV